MKSAPSTVTLNMQTLVGVLDEILNTSNGFLYDSNLVTKEKFKTAILSVMNDSYKNSTWNAFKLPVTIPDVSGDGISFKAAYTEQPAPTPAQVP